VSASGLRAREVGSGERQAVAVVRASRRGRAERRCGQLASRLCKAPSLWRTPSPGLVPGHDLRRLGRNAVQLPPLRLTDTSSVRIDTIGSSYARRNGLASSNSRIFDPRVKLRSRRFGPPCAHVPARRRFRSTALLRFRNPSVDRQHANNGISSRCSSTPRAPVNVPAPTAKNRRADCVRTLHRGEHESCCAPHLREQAASGTPTLLGRAPCVLGSRVLVPQRRVWGPRCPGGPCQPSGGRQSRS
jgi:hypothetical protein